MEQITRATFYVRHNWQLAVFVEISEAPPCLRLRKHDGAGAGVRGDSSVSIVHRCGSS